MHSPDDGPLFFTFSEHVAGELRARVARAHIKRAELAQSLNKSPQWLSRKLNGDSLLITDIELITTALNIPPLAVFAGAAEWLARDLDRASS